MKNPITVLFDEHEIILSAVDIARDSDRLLDKDEEAYRHVIRQLIDFFRVYADQYHHHKEEKILFPEMNKKNELLEEGVVKEMFENHEDFRNMVKGVEEALEKRNYPEVQSRLHTYTDALLDHIAVENEEVFQMAETLFDEEELERIYFRFDDLDRDMGELNKERLVNQLGEIQKVLL